MTIEDLIDYCKNWSPENNPVLYWHCCDGVIASSSVKNKIQEFRKQNSELCNSLFCSIIVLVDGVLHWHYPVEYRVNNVFRIPYDHSIKIDGDIIFNRVGGVKVEKFIITLPDMNGGIFYSEFKNELDYSDIHKSFIQSEFIENLYDNRNECINICNEKNLDFSRRISDIAVSYNVIKGVVECLK